MELNPFERSFAKDPPLAPIVFVETSGGATGTNDSSIGSDPVSTTVSSEGHSQKIPGTQVAGPENSEGDAGGSNKHNLRISNFSSVNNDRLPRLTPPLFTPGGRRLPPIQLSPGGALGSPGTPGNLWNSLLSATNTQPNENGQVQANYAQFAHMMRKSGLTPNELNLRSGFTPNAVNHAGFIFNQGPATPGVLAHGQITPGLSSLLGLHPNNHPVEEPFPVPNAPAQEVPPPAVEEVVEHGEDEDDEHTVKEEPEEEIASKSGTVSESDRSTKKARKSKDSDRPRKLRVATEDDKRQQFLERNRVAASKCRQRKKQLFRKMEDELSFYSTGYRELSAQVTQLRDQLLVMREVVLGHKNCPVLLNSVGGFQQLQNIIGQADYVAQVAANAQPNYTSMPSTIPTTLNAQPAPPVKQVMPYQEMEMADGIPRNYPQAVDHGNGALRPVSSTSNLQNEKGTYGIRTVSSMADLQEGS